jgi:hypothetical protein
MKTYGMALAHGENWETWKDSKFFNPSDPISVVVWGNMRFRTDTRKRTTKKELIKAGWKLDHVLHTGRIEP